MKSYIKVLASTVAMAALTSTAMAQITYVDATSGAGGNTTLTNGAQWDPLTSQSFANDDGLWEVRAFENDNTIFQNTASGTTSDDAHRLMTSITGLTDGDYFVYAYFWSDTSSWRMQASLTDNPGGDLPLYQANPNSPGTTQWYTGGDATVLSSSFGYNPFTTDVVVGDSNRRLLQINLGQTTVSGGTLTVYIDDGPALTGQDERTWYDGIGYSTTFVPEPSSMALLGFGALLATFAVRRRMS